MDDVIHLFVAFGIGLLIGLERGWKRRDAAEGSRIAGIRTFTLVGMFGGVTGLLADRFGPLVIGLGLLAMAILGVTAYVQKRAVQTDLGLTTIVALLLTYSLGVLCMFGYASVAASVAVVATLILSLKPTLHQWLQKLHEQELLAGLKLLLISVVLLPVLPNQGFGPWKALNPYELWWLVILIAAISFAGYFAIRLAGARRGTLYTALFGGLVSSTAVTMNFSRLATRDSWQLLLSTGILVAAATMFPRMLIEVAVVNREILLPVAIPLGAMCITVLAWVALRYVNLKQRVEIENIELKNPLELATAVRFGLLLAVITLLAAGARTYFGEKGIYILALISGLVDVDAITLSLSRMAGSQLTPIIAVHGIVLAAVSNTFVKVGLVLVIGGRRFAAQVAVPLLVAGIVGGASLYLVALQ